MRVLLRGGKDHGKSTFSQVPSTFTFVANNSPSLQNALCTGVSLGEGGSGGHLPTPLFLGGFPPFAGTLQALTSTSGWFKHVDNHFLPFKEKLFVGKQIRKGTFPVINVSSWLV